MLYHDYSTCLHKGTCSSPHMHRWHRFFMFFIMTAAVLTCECSPADPCACTTGVSCRNLVAMCLVFCYQQHLSLRTQVVNPLVLVFIVLASTAALVGDIVFLR
jgi:hypothetical protein